MYKEITKNSSNSFLSPFTNETLITLTLHYNVSCICPECNYPELHFARNASSRVSARQRSKVNHTAVVAATFGPRQYVFFACSRFSRSCTERKEHRKYDVMFVLHNSTAKAATLAHRIATIRVNCYSLNDPRRPAWPLASLKLGIYGTRTHDHAYR